jgi:hypothetical protein
MTLKDEILALAAAHKANKDAGLGNPVPHVPKRIQNLNRKENSCDRKEPMTRAMAKLVARRIRWNNSSTVEPYHCKWCGFWHVGRPPERKRKQQEDP